MRLLYFDCFSGVSGDMILGALVDAGLAAEALSAEIARLGVAGLELSFKKVESAGGVSGTRAVVAARHGGPHRHLPDILQLIRGSGLAATVKDRAAGIFRRLAEAEAKVHAIPPEHVHFHEVGALDAIADVVGAAAGLTLLGIDKVYSSPLPLGSGTVQCAHGTLPVPAPAVVELCRGFPVRLGGLEEELTTPTGAAIVTTLAEPGGGGIDIVPERVGYGFGQREREGLPNALRVVCGTAPQPAGTEEVFLLETNVDDVSGQVLGFLMERCLGAGALDVFFTPIQMKKNRPAWQVSVLCRRRDLDGLQARLLVESGSLGVRILRMERAAAARETVTVQTTLGPVRVKHATFPGGLARSSVEYEDVARLAREAGVPLQEMRERVEAEIRDASS